jgi:hypothetical protein
MKKRVIILKTQDGDWEGLFIDGKRIEEGHTLGEGNSRLFLLKMAEKYDFSSRDVVECEINDEDDAEIEKWGQFPKELSTLIGKYDIV